MNNVCAHEHDMAWDRAGMYVVLLSFFVSLFPHSVSDFGSFKSTIQIKRIIIIIINKENLQSSRCALSRVEDLLPSPWFNRGADSELVVSASPVIVRHSLCLFTRYIFIRYNDFMNVSKRQLSHCDRHTLRGTWTRTWTWTWTSLHALAAATFCIASPCAVMPDRMSQTC